MVILFNFIIIFQLQLGLLAVIYSGGACTAAMFRSKNDLINDGLGGALVGMFLGLKTRKINNFITYGLGCGGLALFTSFVEQSFKQNMDDSSVRLAKGYEYLNRAQMEKKEA